jgi:hypothetical protein
MKKMRTLFVAVLLGLFTATINYFPTPVEAAPSARPSARPSAPTRSSSPSRSSPSPSQRPSQRPSSPTPSQRPSSPPSVPSARPSQRPSQSSDDKKDQDSTTYGNSSKPKSNSINPNGTGSAFNAKAVDAKQKQEGRVAYEKANPKPEYKTPTGQSVRIDPNSTSTQRVRSVSPEKIVQHDVRVEHHYHNYGSRYDDWRSRPYIDVGGGYSPLFWYMMMDTWDDNRKAQWFYNNQNTINQNVFNQQLQQNAALRAKIEEMRRNGVQPDPNYVDPEFKGEEDMMYDQNFVQAAAPVKKRSWLGGWGCLCTTLSLVLIGVLVWFVFFRKHDDFEYR